MISMESTPAIRPCRVGHRGVLGLGLEQVGERVAHHVVEVEDRLGAAVGGWPARSRPEGRSRRASRAGGAPSRPAGRAGPPRPRASPSPRAVDWPTKASGACQRSMSRTLISASRFSARSAPTKSSTKSFAGAIRSSAGVAYWARRPPSWRIAIRSPILIASSMSWVTKRTVFRISVWSRRNSFCRRSRLIGSIGPEGLVHQHHRRVGRQRPRDADALLLSARELAGEAVAQRWARGRSGRAARRRAPGPGRDPSRGAGARSRCSGRPCGAGRARSAGSRSPSRGAARAGSRSRTEVSPIRMSPSVISTVRLTIRSAVVLPLPDGPTSTQISPASTSSERSWIAGSSWPG